MKPHKKVRWAREVTVLMGDKIASGLRADVAISNDFARNLAEFFGNGWSGPIDRGILVAVGDGLTADHPASAYCAKESALSALAEAPGLGWEARVLPGGVGFALVRGAVRLDGLGVTWALQAAGLNFSNGWLPDPRS
jgi:hypothetical protein